MNLLPAKDFERLLQQAACFASFSGGIEQNGDSHKLSTSTLNRHDRKVVQQGLSGAEGLQIIQASKNKRFRSQRPLPRQKTNQPVLAIFLVGSRASFRHA